MPRSELLVSGIRPSAPRVTKCLKILYVHVALQRLLLCGRQSSIVGECIARRALPAGGGAPPEPLIKEGQTCRWGGLNLTVVGVGGAARLFSAGTLDTLPLPVLFSVLARLLAAGWVGATAREGSARIMSAAFASRPTKALFIT